MVDIDRVRSCQRAPIVIDDVDLRKSLDPECSSHGISGPISCRAPDPAILEDCAHRVKAAFCANLVLLMGVGRCAHVTMPHGFTVIGRPAISVDWQGRGRSLHREINLSRQKPFALPTASRGGPERAKPCSLGRLPLFQLALRSRTGQRGRRLEEAAAGQDAYGKNGQRQFKEQDFHEDRQGGLIVNKTKEVLGRIF